MKGAGSCRQVSIPILIRAPLWLAVTWPSALVTLVSGPRDLQFPFSKSHASGNVHLGQQASSLFLGDASSLQRGHCRLRCEGGITWYPQMSCIRRSHITLLVRTECRTFTAAYKVWSSVAKEMRPRRMAGPPMKSRLLAAGLEWNTLTPVWDKGHS